MKEESGWWDRWGTEGLVEEHSVAAGVEGRWGMKGER